MENEMFVTVLQKFQQNNLYLLKLFENVFYEIEKVCVLALDDFICLLSD